MRAALESVPGVRNVDVRFDEKEVRVVADREGLDVAAMIEALEKAGYPSSVKDPPAP